MTADDVRRDPIDLDDLLQAYVDGTLDEKTALRVHLNAQGDAAIGRRIEEERAFFAHLDALPREEPGPDFDAAVLRTVPLQRYRTAPRRHAAVLVLDDFAPSRLAATLRSLSRVTAGFAVAYVATLVLGGTQIGRVISDAAGRIEFAVADSSSGLEGNALLGPVVSGLGSVYSAAEHGVGAMVDGLGMHAATAVLGLAVGLFALGVLTGRRRRTQGEARARS